MTALDLFKRETNYFIHNSMLFNLELFKIDTHYISKKFWL
jgi:phosphate:Na+ symporter